jgi:hypothetical protein
MLTSRMGRLSAALLVAATMTTLGCGDEPVRRHHDDDDGGGGSGAGGGGGGDPGGAGPTTWSAEVEWQTELDAFQQTLRATGPANELFVDDGRYSPAWHVDKLAADGTAVTGSGWPLDYSIPNGTYAGRTAIGADGTVVLVGGESFGWHTAKLDAAGNVEWVRVRGTGGDGWAEAANVSLNGAITVVGGSTMFGDCMITRYLADGTELDGTWLRVWPGTAFCNYVVSDDARVYVPSGSYGGDGALHVLDAASGEEIAATELPGATMGAEVGLLSVVPGGGVLVGYHGSAGSNAGRYLWLVDAGGAVVWQQHLAELAGRVGARADGELVASVTAPVLSSTQGVVTEGELVLTWLRRDGDALVEAGGTSLAEVRDAVVFNVVALADGAFAVQWATDTKTPADARYHVAKLRPTVAP